METSQNIALVFKAIQQNNIETVKLLLENNINPNMQNDEGYTPLFVAGYYTNFDIVKLLLEYGADPNMQNKGWSPLFVASNFEIVKLLLEHGADPNIQSNSKQTPLMNASYRNKHEIIKILIDYGTDYNIINKDGKTAFDYNGGDFIREYLKSKEHQIILK